MQILRRGNNNQRGYIPYTLIPQKDSSFLKGRGVTHLGMSSRNQPDKEMEQWIQRGSNSHTTVAVYTQRWNTNNLCSW